MRIALLLALVARAFSMSAACTGAPSDCVEVNLTVDGKARIYQYHLPQGSQCATTNLPVVMFLHGGGGTANAMQNSVGYAASNRNCYIQVFPEGTRLPAGGVFNNGDCIGLPPSSGYTGPTALPGCGYRLDDAGVDDIHYFNALLDDLKQRTNHDPRRVYAGGWSNGGGMSHRLACELSERITAIAPIEGTIKVPQCTPTRAVPMIQWAALGDTTSPFNGGSGDTSVPYSVSVRLGVCQLPDTPTTTFVVPSVLSAARTDTVRQWVGGKDGCVVVLHTLSNQHEHNWLFDEPIAFDWQEINWTFFKQFALPPQSAKRRAVRK